MALVDTVCIGRGAGSSPVPLAATGSANAVVGIALSIFNFLTSATTPLVASRRAAGDPGGARTIGGQALTLALMIGLSLTAVLSVGARFFLTGVGSNAAGTLGLATVLVRVRAAAAPAVLLMSASVGILRGCLDTRTPLQILASATILNIFLDIIFVFGFGWGAIGAAAATTISEWVSAIALLGRLQSGITGKTGDELLKVQPTWNVNLTLAIPLLRASAAIFGRTVVLQGALTTATAFAAFGSGAVGAAAHEVARQLWLLCSFICDSLAAAAQALIARSMGIGDRQTAKRIAQAVSAYGLILGCILSVILSGLLKLRVIPELLTRDIATAAAARQLLSIVILAQPFNAFVFVADGIMQGAQDFGFQFRSMVFACLLSASITVGLARFEGSLVPRLPHIWIGLYALSLGRAVSAAWRYTADPTGPLRT